MEETIIYSDEMIRILEEIQINSYNTQQEFKRLNEEILTTTTTATGIKTNYIESSTQGTSIILMLFIIFITFELIKLRGEKRG